MKAPIEPRSRFATRTCNWCAGKATHKVNFKDGASALACAVHAALLIAGEEVEAKETSSIVKL